MNIERMQTKTAKYHEHGSLMTHRVTFGFHYLQGNRRPYFSITSDIRENGREYAGGCCHEEVAKHFPRLRPLIKWHCVDDDAHPMHYEANAAFWLEYFHGINKYERKSYDPDPLEAFKHTVVFGAVDTDEATLPDLLAPIVAPDELQEVLNPGLALKNKQLQLGLRVQQWCNARREKLLAAMKKDMEAFEVKYIDPSEYTRGNV